MDLQDFFLTRADCVRSNFERVRTEIETSGRNRLKGGTGKRTQSTSDQMRKLFPQMKKHCKKPSSWTHRFVCLAHHDQNIIPTTAWEKDVLISAGLGEKKIVFENADCDASVFKEVLLNSFPKLQDAGGYQLCKCKSNSRELEPLSAIVLSSPRALQGCSGNSRTYIRPLQSDLDLTRLDEYLELVSTYIYPV